MELPVDCKIHDVFHVSKLKAFVGVAPDQPPALPAVIDGRLMLQPQDILHAMFNRNSPEILVEWKGLSKEDVTWEPLHEFKR